ncbi:MAG TPA: hypothetical protein PKD90_19645 [Phnomibacter sp.]|nr:hypothetical protein [Phnomibacter sp.]
MPTCFSSLAQLSARQLKLGNATLTWVQYCRTPQPGIYWINVHENETTSVQAARAVMDSIGSGCMVAWKHSGDRYFTFQQAGKTFKFDPNRIFTPAGLKKTLQANGAYTTAGYNTAQKAASQFIKQYVAGNKLLIALHNNTDGGGLHIKSYLPGGEYAQDAELVHVNEQEDVDDFFYTTDRRIYDYLSNRGFNILLQNNATVTDDGSMSVYCGQQGMAYLNIEAQHGHLNEQKRMIAAVFDMIRDLGF